MIKRVLLYLSEMYPLKSVFGTIALSVVIQLLIFQIDERAIDFSVITISFISLVCFSLLLRIMDEFKDYEDDLKNFPNRPLPSGKVTFFDLKILSIFCVIVPLILNVKYLNSYEIVLIVLIYSFLMLKWFFIETWLRKSLPLAFITHHPIVFLHFFYLGAMVNPAKFHWEILPLGLMLTNWEFSRKIRSPQNETTYTTYSKIFGVRKATLLTLFTQAIFIFTTSYLIYSISNRIEFLLLLVPSYIISFFYILFLIKPTRSYTFKVLAENQILNVVGALLVVIVWKSLNSFS